MGRRFWSSKTSPCGHVHIAVSPTSPLRPCTSLNASRHFANPWRSIARFQSPSFASLRTNTAIERQPPASGGCQSFPTLGVINAMSEVFIGSCLCASVTYEVRGPFLRFAHCYCSRCRKATALAMLPISTSPLITSLGSKAKSLSSTSRFRPRAASEPLSAETVGVRCRGARAAAARSSCLRGRSTHNRSDSHR